MRDRREIEGRLITEGISIGGVEIHPRRVMEVEIAMWEVKGGGRSRGRGRGGGRDGGGGEVKLEV